MKTKNCIQKYKIKLFHLYRPYFEQTVHCQEQTMFVLKLGLNRQVKNVCANLPA